MKARIIVSAILSMLAAQLILAAIGLINADKVKLEIEQKADEKIVTEVNRNLLSMFRSMYDLFSLLETADFSGDFKKPWLLQDPEEGLRKKAIINHRLNELNLSPQLVERIFFIGADEFRINLAKTIGDADWSGQPLPDLASLEKAGLTAPLFSHYGRLSFIEPGSLVDSSPTASLSPSQRKDEKLLTAQQLAKQLEGKLVFNNGNDNGVLILVVVNPSFFTSILPKGKSDHTMFSLLDESGKSIWSNVPDKALGERIAGAASAYRSAEEASFTLDYHGESIRNAYRLLSPYKFKLVFSTDLDYAAAARSEIIRKYITVSVVTLIITSLIAMSYTNRILRPMQLVSRQIKKLAQSDHFPIKPIGLGNGSQLSALSVRRKLLILYTVTVIIPAIADGLLYTNSLYDFSRSSFESSVRSVSGYYSESLTTSVQMYENLINRISVSPELQDLISMREKQGKNDFGSIETPTAVPISVASFLQGFGDISYYVLFDQLGVPRYSSTFSNNLTLFKMDLNKLLKQQHEKQFYWMTDLNDVFKLSNVALIKRINGFTADNGQTEATFYLQLVLKDSAFQLSNTEQVNIAIVDNHRNVIYQNVARKEDLAAVLGQNSPAADGHAIRWLGGDERTQTAVYAGLEPSTKWTIYVFHSYEGTSSINRELFYQFLLVITLVFVVSILIGLYLSKRLVRPLEDLKFYMEEAGKGEFKQLAYNKQNEIGRFIGNFNQMITTINQLVDENAAMMEENARNKLKEQELLSSKTKAELRMLQAQINPHFLYNTLEAINMRSVRYGTTEISTMVIALADILRYSIRSGPELVSMATEIKHLQNYIAIQEIRFGFTFEVEWRVQPEVMDAQVLKFILQPVIENAINHGLSGYESGGKLVISAEKSEGQLIMTVEDNGAGMRAGKLEQLLSTMTKDFQERGEKEEFSSGGLGLHNVYHRLQIYYRGEASMTIRSKRLKGTVVQLIVPLAMP